jgi:hypothetical protein
VGHRDGGWMDEPNSLVWSTRMGRVVT